MRLALWVSRLHTKPTADEIAELFGADPAAWFTHWAMGMRSFPTVDEIVARFHVSRATAHRWRLDLATALSERVLREAAV